MFYDSLYASPSKKVPAYNFIAELVCANNAQRNKRELPKNFWALSEWSKYYFVQRSLALKLVKKYDERAIIRAVREKHIWSLYPDWLNNLFKQYEHSIKNQQESFDQIEDATFSQSKEQSLDYLDG